MEWSASATARNWQCAGAIALSTLAGAEKESIHAATGTAVHQIAEKCLRTGADASAFLDTIEKTKEHDIPITEEEVESAQSYVDYVRTLPGEILIEKKFSLASLSPPFEAGGTCDAIAISEKLLEVVDLKNGRGVVNPFENKQLRTYALAALLNLPAEKIAGIEQVKSTIAQPRAPVRGEIIRSEIFHGADLIDWASDLLQAMHKAKEAKTEFEQVNGSRVAFDEWGEKWLSPGSCTFCPAEGLCPKLKKRALSITPEKVKEWFEDTTLETPPDLKNAPELLGPEELGHALDGLDMLESWVKALRAYAHTQADRGLKIPGWQLSDKIGNRAWVETDEAKLADLFRDKFGMPPDEMFVAKIKSPAQIEKLIGAKRKAEVDALCHKPVKGTNLVSSAKTTRPPAKSKVETFAEEVKD